MPLESLDKKYEACAVAGCANEKGQDRSPVKRDIVADGNGQAERCRSKLRDRKTRPGRPVIIP